MQRTTVGYILILVLLILAINVCIVCNDILSLHLELGLLDPELPKEEKLFNARFLYAQSPAFLDEHAEWKSAAREAIADEQQELSKALDNEPKTKDEIVRDLAKKEKSLDIVAVSEESEIGFLLLLLLFIGLGMHFIAKSVSASYLNEIRLAPESSVLGIGFGITVILVFLLTDILGLLGTVNPLMTYIGPLLGNIILLIFIIQHVNSKGYSFLKEIGLKSGQYRRAILTGIAGFFAFLPIQIILNTQGMLMSYSFGFLPESHPFIQDFMGTSSYGIQIIIVILVLFSAPVFEEIFFRGIFLQAFEQRTSPVVACIFTGFVFGIIHPGFVAKFMIIFLGIYLAFLMQKTRSLITPVVVHFMFNANALFQLLISK